MNRPALLLTCGFALLLSCKTVTPDAPFRAQPPAALGTSTFTPPVIQELTLSNGIRVLALERHQLPIVQVTVLFNRGAGDDGVIAPWQSAIMGGLLETGAGALTASQISERYQAIGAAHGAEVRWDTASAGFKVVSTGLDAALELLATVVQTPTFTSEELSKVIAQRKTGIAFLQRDARKKANNAKDVALLGRGDAYGKTYEATAAQLDSITHDGLVQSYQRLFAADRASILVTGDVKPAELLPKLEAAFGRWQTKAPADLGAHVTESSTARVVLVNQPKAPQSVLYVAQRGPARSTPDRIALQVMNAVFGDIFASRINLNLRERLAISYGVGSTVWAGRRPGLIYAGGSVTAAKTGLAASELLAEVRAMQDRLVTPEELADAKEAVKRSITAPFESIDGSTEALRPLIAYQRPLNAYSTDLEEVERITAEDVQRVAKQYLKPDEMKIIAAGDLEVIRPQLEALKLGSVEVRDAFGDLVKE